MTKILSFDIASHTGVGFYDTEKAISQIECFSIHFDAKGPFEKEKQIRHMIPPIIKQYGPDFIIMEMPLQNIKQYEKKPKKDLMTGAQHDDGDGFNEQAIDAAVAAATKGFQDGVDNRAAMKAAIAAYLHRAAGNKPPEMTMNAAGVIMLNRLAAAIHLIVEGFKIPCEEVRPMTWQTIIPKQYKGSTKDRVRQYCDAMRIIGKNMDARDAAIIALWAAGRAQTLKLAKRTQEQLL